MKKVKGKSQKAKFSGQKAEGQSGFSTFNSLFLAFAALCFCHAAANFCQAQTGGGYDLSHNLIAAGGGRSAGGGITLDAAAGQPAAGGVSTGAGYALRGGFWAFQSLAPTAAFVSVAGRVTTAEGLGIRHAAVKLTDSRGAIRLATTGSFGYFRFADVEIGETYLLEVSSRRFTFSKPVRVLTVSDEIADADFTAELQ